MNNITSYCIELTPGQLDYLAGSKYGIDRMKILHCLISAVVLKETIYSIKGFTTTLQAGQGIMSEVDLSNRLHYDKKTISRVLDRMNELGIVATTQSNRTSVHSLKCVSAWIVGGSLVANPFHVHTSSHPLPIDKCHALCHHQGQVGHRDGQPSARGYFTGCHVPADGSPAEDAC